MICEPGILLLDEPFGALDPGITADMHKLILELWSQTAMTIFMITHDIKEGFELGTRLLVFDKVRHDPQAPDLFGARITYDIPLRRRAAIGGRPLAAAG
jgi:NitT/TauT family transport system ATP-binding protein